MTTPKITTLTIRLGETNIDDTVEEITGFEYGDSYYDDHHTEVRHYTMKGSVTPEQFAEMQTKINDVVGRVYDWIEIAVEEDDDEDAEEEEVA